MSLTSTWYQAHNQALDYVDQKDKFMMNPSSLCIDIFGFTPNKKQAEFLRDLQNPGILEHYLQAPRGGGKTITVAASVCWAALKYSPFRALVLSGSFFQAKQFYGHIVDFVNLSEHLQNAIDGEPLQSQTKFRDGGEIICLTASEKMTRAPHVDMLIIDEFVICDRDVVFSALPTTDASERPKMVYLTTASQTKACKALDLWLDWWDDADGVQQVTYEWSKEDCHWLNEAQIELMRKKMDPLTFQTEYLGQRAPRMGAVFKSPQIMHAVETASKFNFIPDQPTFGGIDWGTVHPTVVTIVQPQLDEVIVVIEVIADTDQNVSWWCDDIIPVLTRKYKVKAWYCDAGGKPFNKQLEDSDQPVVVVPFQTFKDQMIGELRRELEYKLIKIPSHFEGTIRELKYYRYDPKTQKPIKEQDDYVDSLMLATWGATGKGLDKFELFAYESKEREERFKRKKKDDWWRDLVD